MYKISDSTEFEDTVIRLVELVQTCLYIFGFFKHDVDGLLCSATECGLEEFYNAFLRSSFQVLFFFFSSSLFSDPNSGFSCNIKGKS